MLPRGNPFFCDLKGLPSLVHSMNNRPLWFSRLLSAFPPRGTRMATPLGRRMGAGGWLWALALVGLASASPAWAALTVNAPGVNGDYTYPSWDIVGLDSNNPATGPNHFPIGARVCSNVATTNVAVSFIWDSANSRINLTPGSPAMVTIPSIAAGGCASAYFDVEITPVAAAFNTVRRYHITATDGSGTASSPVPRQLYVERLISQSRNAVLGFSLNGAPQSPGSTWNLQLGNTYQIAITSSTATQGYNQLENFFNLPGYIFQILSVSSTYTANSAPNTLVPVPNPSIYANACGWDANPSSPNYNSCIGGDGKVGGNGFTTTYTVRIIGGAGTSAVLNALTYDFSGSSFHYNSDFARAWVNVNIQGPVFSKKFSAAVTGGTSTLTFTLTNPSANAISNVSFIDNLPTTPGAMLVAAAPNATTADCGSPTFAPTAGSASLSFSNGTIAAGGTCTISVAVTVPATGTYNNTSNNLFIGANDTGLKATASLTVAPAGAGTGICGTTIGFATPTVGTGQTLSTITGGYEINAWPTANAIDTTKYVQFFLNDYVTAQLAFNGLRTSQGPTTAVLYQSTNAAFTGATQVATITQAGSGVATWAFTTASQTYGATALAATGGRYFRIYAYNAGNGVGSRNLSLTNISFTGCVPASQPPLTKAFSPNPVAVNGESTLTFTLGNTNTVPLTGVRFSDNLPAGLVVAATPTATTTCGGSPSWTPAAGDTVLNFGQPTGATIPASGSCTVGVRVRATTAGVHNNVSGLIFSTEGGTNTTGNGFGSASLTALLPPSIEKSFSNGFINPGDTTTLSFLIGNPNPANALGGIAFTDTYPSGLVNSGTPAVTNTCGGAVVANAGVGSISLSGGSLAAGASCTITVVVTAPAAGTYPNGVQVSAVINGNTVNGNTSTDTLSVRAPIGGISLLKQVSSTGNTGPWTAFTNVSTTPSPGSVWYRFTVENTGELPLSPVSVIDPKVSASGCSWPNPLPVAGPSTDPTANCVVGPVTGQSGLNPNTATAFGTAGGTTYNDSASAAYFGAAPGFHLLKEISASASGPWSQYLSIAPGASVYYRFSLSNTGNVALTNPAVTDPNVNTASCAFTNPLPVGGATFCIVGPVAASNASPPVTFTNTAQGSGKDPGNNTVTTAPSSATYKTVSTAVTIGGNVFRDNGKGCVPPSLCASNGIWNITSPADEPIFNVNGTAPLYVVIVDSGNNLLAVAEMCPSSGFLFDMTVCSPGAWTAAVPAGTNYTAWVTPNYPAGPTVAPPGSSTPPAGWIMTKGSVNGTAQGGSVLSFSPSSGTTLNFGVVRGSCPI